MDVIEHPEDHDGTDSPTDLGKLFRREWTRTEFLAEIDGLEDLVSEYRKQLRGAVEALEWLADRYAATPAGKFVRDADEALERARLIVNQARER